jgi:hypothetical protein
MGSRVDLGTVMKRIMLVTFGVLIIVNVKILSSGMWCPDFSE